MALAQGAFGADSIPEILKLKNDETIPEKVMASHGSREIAASIVERLRVKQQASTKKIRILAENLYDFRKDSEIQLLFQDKYFHSIRKSCFKNQHQTNTSGGALAKKQRMEAEDTLSGLKIKGSKDPKSIANRVRPKYAFLTLTKPMVDVPENFYAFSYGNIFAVFKDDVKERSTFTTMDSLDIPDIGKSFNVQSDYKDLRKGKYAYWEAQLWGDVCFSDVSYFLIDCPGASSVASKVLSEIKQTGIPVYDCKLEMQGVNQAMQRDHLLVPEDLEKRAQDEANANPN